MTVLNDKQILELCRSRTHSGLIDNYSEHQVREVDDKRVISYGLSSYGYDARLADEFMTTAEASSWSVIDPKNEQCFFRCRARSADGAFVVAPHSMALARTVEHFRIPDDVLAICLGKSTYARCGLIVNVTPLEPGWWGHVTLELSNTTPLPIKVYPNEGICQFVFFRGELPSTTYATRAGGPGKYQGQVGVTTAKV